MPRQIILVRHGETDFNREKIVQGQLDTFLNPSGLIQAQKAAEKLVGKKIDALYSSDLKRTFQTAQVIAQKLNMAVQKTPLLRERSFGGFEGLRFEEIDKYYQNLPFSWYDSFVDSVSRHFKVETNEEMKKRIKIFLKMLKVKQKNKNVLLVVHGGVIRVMLSILKLKEAIGESSETIFANAGVCVLEKRRGGYKLELQPDGLEEDL